MFSITSPMVNATSGHSAFSALLFFVILLIGMAISIKVVEVLNEK